MKKLIILAILFGVAPSLYAASNKDLSGRVFQSYDDTGKVQSLELTLSGTAGLASTVTIPSWANGFRLYPRSNSIRFYVDTSTVSAIQAVGVVATGAAASTNSFTNGDIAKNDLWETRLLPCSGGSGSGCTQRYLYLNSTTVSVVIDVTVFGRKDD